MSRYDFYVPLLIHFYGLSLAEVEDMTMGQFRIFLGKISEILSFFMPETKEGTPARTYPPIDRSKILKSRRLGKARGLL